ASAAIAAPMIFGRALAALAADGARRDARPFHRDIGVGPRQIQQHRAIGIHRGLLGPAVAVAAAVPPVVAVVGVVRIRAITVGAQAFRLNAEDLAVFVYLPVAAGGAPVRDLHRAPGSGIAVVVAPAPPTERAKSAPPVSEVFRRVSLLPRLTTPLSVIVTV